MLYWYQEIKSCRWC